MSNDDDDPRDHPDEAKLKAAGENDLAARIRDAIGAGPDEPIRVRTPQFERRDGRTVDWTPDTARDIYGLTTASDDELVELGLRRWEDDHWLLPAEWYAHIPAGTVLETITGEVIDFEPGETDDDRRFGVLPYGIRTDTEVRDDA